MNDARMSAASGTRSDPLQARESMSDVKAQVRRYIEENFLFGAGARAPADDASLIDHQLIDSTGFLELVAFLEQAFSIEVGDEEMTPENLDSLDALAAYVERKRAG